MFFSLRNVREEAVKADKRHGYALDDHAEAPDEQNELGQIMNDPTSSRKAVRDANAAAASFSFTVYASWSNETFMHELCAQLELLDPEIYFGGEFAISIDNIFPLKFELPSCFADYAQLFESISLKSVIVDGWGQLGSPNLKSLSFTNTHLSIPTADIVDFDFDWDELFLRFPNLTGLNFENCGLSGSLPSSLPPQLISLRLPNNQLTGTIPRLWTPTSPPTGTSIIIDFSKNRLTGSLSPRIFETLPVLESLTFFLSSNLLTGNLTSDIFSPAMNDFNSLNLDVSNNKLSGTLPPDLFKFFSQLDSLIVDFSSNRLQGTLPDNFSNLFHSQALLYLSFSFANNSIEGNIPSQLIQPGIPHFIFDASSNNLTGNIPQPLIVEGPCASGKLLELHFGNNALSGTIPNDLLANCTGPYWLTLNFSKNDLSGPLFENPSALSLFGLSPGTYPGQLADFDFSHNQLVGEIAPFVFQNASAPRLIFNASHNQLHGSIPASLFSTELSPTQPVVWTVDFSNNKFTKLAENGLLSFYRPNVGLGGEFQIHLESNLFSGPLPTRFYDPSPSAGTATYIYLDKNDFNGSLPSTLLSGCRSAIFISIGENNIEGTIYPEMFLENDAAVLIAPKNKISRFVSFDENPSEPQPPTIKILMLDLSDNLLVELPNENSFARITQLALVNVKNNPLLQKSPSSSSTSHPSDFHAIFPDPFWNVLQLLIASNCSLSGTIPEIIANRLPLGLDLSNNHLEGSAPAIYQNTTIKTWMFDISNNPGINGSVPAFWNDIDKISYFVSIANTSIEGVLPPVDPKLHWWPDSPDVMFLPKRPITLDLSGTKVELCSNGSLSTLREPWNPLAFDSTLVCNLDRTSACQCPHLWPRCSTFCPVLISPSSACPERTRPSLEFECIDGTWTSPTSITTPTLVIPAGAATVVINGNISSFEIILQGLGTTVFIKGCAFNLEQVVIELSKSDIDTIQKEKSGSQSRLLLVSETDGSECSNLALTKVKIKSKEKNCRKPLLKTSSSSTKQRLSVILSVDTSKCNVWWIVLVSVLAVLIIAGAIITAIVLSQKKARKIPSVRM